MIDPTTGSNERPSAEDRDRARRAHLGALGEYLGDQLAPIQVASSVLWLLRHEAEETAAELRSWSHNQHSASQEELPIRVLYFHALRKLAVLGELGVVDEKLLRPFVDQLASTLVSFTPAQERSVLRRQLARLWDPDQAVSKVVELLHGAAGGEGAGAQVRTEDGHEQGGEAAGGDEAKASARPGRTPSAAAHLRRAKEPSSVNPDAAEAGSAAEPASGEDGATGRAQEAPSPRPASAAETEDLAAERGLRRLSLLFDRIESTHAQSAAGVPASGGASPIGETLVAAANAARSPHELRQQLARLQSAGLENVTFETLLEKLTAALPAWTVASNDLQAIGSPSLQAVRNVVRYSGSPGGELVRMQQVVRTAVRHANEAELGRSVTVLSLVDQLFQSSGVPHERREQLLEEEGRGLAIDTLLRLARTPENHIQLRAVLRAFPQTRAEGLVERLRSEGDRRSRHQIIELLLIHGPVVRPFALRLLPDGAPPPGDPPPWYVIRNAILLLRRIPADDGAPSEAEVDAVIHFADVEQPVAVCREALLYLGAAPQERAGDAIAGCLLALLRCGLDRDIEEGVADAVARLQILALRQLLQRPEPESHAVALDFLIKESRWQPAYTELLREFGRKPLFGDPASVRTLTEALDLTAQRKRFSGRLLARLRADASEERLRAIVSALARTPLPEVDRALAGLSGQGLGTETMHLVANTRKALAEQTLTPASPPSLTGDLQLFGMPGLLQTLEAQRTSGLLTLSGQESRDWAKLRLYQGELVDTVFGKRRGRSAFFHLMQHPFACRFELVVDEKPTAPMQEPGPITPLLLEALRRADELHQMRALVPGEQVLQPGDVTPTPPEGEDDGQLLRTLWVHIKTGLSAGSCETQADVDAWRVRRVLTHWLDTGAVRLAPSAALVVAIAN